MADEALLLWGVVFSSLGLGYFIYGKRQGAPVPLVCGLVLMVYPYFISSALVLVALGMVLAAIPYFIRL
jgi:hypothetical protein